MKTRKLVVGITGASGAMITQRFLIHAADHFEKIFLMMSAQAYQVIQTELGVDMNLNPFSTIKWLRKEYPQIELLDPKNYFSPPASGSFLHDGMVIVPCSMGTAGRIANGISDDLMTRSADVCLKEGRKLIIVPREMPLSCIMLENLTKLAQAGATILPACPAWYYRPQTVEDLADSVVARILQQLGINQNIFEQWMLNEN